MSHTEIDSDYCGPDDWYWELQSGRLVIADRVIYKRLSPELKAYGIFDEEDDEEVLNGRLNPTSKSRANHMIDKLLKKGEENYEKFIKILGEKYPDVYKKVTGREPPEQPDEPKISICATNDNTILDIVLERLEAKKTECENVSKQNVMLKTDFEERVREIECLKIRIEEMQKRAERYVSMERDMTALKDVVDQVKSENFRVCMMIVNANEENAKRREEIMATQVENDRLKAELKKMASTVNSERSVSVRLRRRIETGPSEKVIRGLQQEIDELKLKLAQSSRETSSVENDTDTRVQILQSDKEEAIQMYAEATEKLNKLREEFNSTETLRDKYLEENDYLKLQVSALTDDCEMYKTRQDANWHKLQEVEKERDQLMKERNEAQITAQNHMDEKTKYRAEIRKLEKTQDDLSHKLREKDTQCRDLTNKLKKFTSKPPGDEDENHSSDTSTATTEKSAENEDAPWRICRRDRAHNTKHFPEFVGKSEFDGTIDSKNSRIGVDGIFPEIPLVANYGNGCGKFEPKRRVGRRRKGNDSRTTRMNSETLSKTSSTDSEYQRRQEDSDLVMVEINARIVQDCVKFIGGNCSGIFIHQVIETQNCSTQCTSLLPGMLLRKIRQPQMKALNVIQWTLEYHNNVIRSMEGTVVFLLEQKQKEYSDLKDKVKNSKMTGDSFYVRANFKWSRENMLNFNKFDILHVINTQPSTEMHWLACKIDPYNGNNAFRCDVIPSYKYCIEHPLQAELLQKTRRNTEPSIFPSEIKDATPVLQQSQSTKTPKSPPSPCFQPLVLGRNENCPASYEPIGKPYTILQPVHLPKDRPRPCLLLPQSLSKIISFKLTTIAEPMLFDFPVPESLSCAIDIVRSRLYDKDVVSFNSVSVDSQELVSTSSVQRTADMGKHCILSINENCISIKDYLKKLQKEDIYPIVIFLHAEKQRTVKVFIDGDQCRPNIVIQDMMLTGEQLKRFGMNYSSVNLERCNKVEDGVQLLIKKIADETNRVVWKEEAGDICI